MILSLVAEARGGMGPGASFLRETSRQRNGNEGNRAFAYCTASNIFRCDGAARHGLARFLCRVKMGIRSRPAREGRVARGEGEGEAVALCVAGPTNPDDEREQQTDGRANEQAGAHYFLFISAAGQE